MKMMRLLTTLAGATFLAFVLSYADEGMYPVTGLSKLDLRALGISLDARDLYNPAGTSLIDAIVNTGGCTGCFVSPEGLILTNHHCVFGSVQAISTPEHDYVTDGFLARERSEEVPARGATVRIIDSYRDVSGEVLSAVNDTLSPVARSGALSARIRSITLEAEGQRAGTRADVAEMVPGKSYVLFLYTYLRDVRLVYVPPRGIGDFGGDTDNWTWPRQTGDFSFLRAYVAPDGSPADYSPRNIPYTPKRHLTIQPAGVDQEDVVFVLGYPGRTYRHRTSDFLAYEQEIRMPFVADLYAWEIAVMREAVRAERAFALKLGAKIETLANTEKNYRGKIQGMRRLHLVDKKRMEEEDMQRFIQRDPQRLARYGSVLKTIAAVYREMTQVADRELILDAFRSISVPLSVAITLNDAARERPKPDMQRLSEYMDRNFGRTKDGVGRSISSFHRPNDKVLLRELIQRAARLPAERKLGGLDAVVGADTSDDALDRYLNGAYDTTRLTDSAYVTGLLADPASVPGDPFLDLARALAPAYDSLREVRQERDGRLSRETALLMDVKQEFLKSNFIPDANGTLRFTYGRVRGYSPADATWYAPFTTLKGVAEKQTGHEPFDAPHQLLELQKKKAYGRYADRHLNDVPVGLLYNLDTTGGNSGSPVMNARGELVGVNFDRVYEATINDYAWSEQYSRSIAVDIRYVLWVTEYIGGAAHLLSEMGVNN
jgi:hypothetical protein